MMRPVREIVLDTETTGLDVTQGHRVIEIGCVEFLGGRRTGRTYHRYLNPARPIEPAATAIHGLTDAARHPTSSPRTNGFSMSRISSAPTAAYGAGTGPR